MAKVSRTWSSIRDWGHIQSWPSPVRKYQAISTVLSARGFSPPCFCGAGMAASHTGYMCWEVPAGQLGPEAYCCCTTLSTAASPPLSSPWGHRRAGAPGTACSQRLRRTRASAAAAGTCPLHPRAAPAPAFPPFPPSRGRSALRSASSARSWDGA